MNFPFQTNRVLFMRTVGELSHKTIDFIKHDGFVKSPDAALRFILRHCGVRESTPHSSGFARLACGAFYGTVEFGLVFDFLRVHQA